MKADRPAFEEVYDEEIWHVFGFLGYRVSPRELAEDLTQATFERAYRAWSRFDASRASPRTWLLSIARNLLIDHYRQRETAPAEAPMPGGYGEGGGEVHTDEPHLGVSPELEDALDSLSDRERELLALRYGGDLTGPEIADLTGLTLANVQRILSRSLRRLRGELEPSSVRQAP